MTLPDRLGPEDADVADLDRFGHRVRTLFDVASAETPAFTATAQHALRMGYRLRHRRLVGRMLAVSAATVVAAATVGTAFGTTWASPWRSQTTAERSSSSAPTAWGPHSASTAGIGQTSPRGAVSAAENKRAAQAEAARLIGLAVVPAGAVVTVTESPPTAASWVVLSRTWSVGLSFGRTVAWLQAHPPSGLTEFGRTSGTDNGSRTVGTIYTEPDTAEWTGVQLRVGAAAATTNSTLIHADAQILWLDPVPMRDIQPGQRLRVTIAGGCPASRNQVIGVTNPGSNPELNAALVPDRPPSGGLLCRYTATNGEHSPPSTPFSLVRSTPLGQLAAQRVPTALQEVRLSQH